MTKAEQNQAEGTASATDHKVLEYLRSVTKKQKRAPATKTSTGTRPPTPLPKPAWAKTAFTVAVDPNQKSETKMKEALVILVVSFLVAIGLQYAEDFFVAVGLYSSPRGPA